MDRERIEGNWSRGALALAAGLALSAGALAQPLSKDDDRGAKADAKAYKLSPDARGPSNAAGAEARKDAASEKRDAEHAAQKEKCDALAGDAKSHCIVLVNARFGKS